MITIFLHVLMNHQLFSYKQKVLKKTGLQLELFLGFVVPFTSFRKLYKTLGQNHFDELNCHILTFLHPILICRVAILSIGGVALHTFVELHQT
jgi:hypothetical protein